jgi:hypothetical protein
MGWLNRKLGYGLLVLLVGVVAWPMRGAAQSSHKPLSKNDTLQLLHGEVPSGRIAELAREQGINFQITPETESELKEAGATDELLNVLRELAPKPLAPPVLDVVSAPGGVQVYIDDALLARTSAEGHLRIATLPPGDHRVRLSLEGYDDYEEKVSLAEGKSVTVLARLAAHAATILEVQSTPGHAQVYVDDVFSGETSEQGQLKVPNLAPGSHRLRLTHEGYREDQRQIEMTAGQTLQVSASLAKVEAPATSSVPPPATPAPAPTQWRVYSKVGGMSYEKGLLTLANGTLTFKPDDAKRPFEFMLTDVDHAYQTMGDLGTRYDLHILLKSGKKYELITLDTAGHGASGAEFVKQMISRINQAQGR